MWYERFAATAAAYPDLPALVTPAATLTYGALQGAVAAWTEQHGRGSGRVIVVEADPVETAVAVIGAWRSGRPVAVLHRGIPAPALAGLLDRLALPVPKAESPELGEGIVLSTSGSTGEPRLVAQSRQALSRYVQTNHAWFALPPGTSALVASTLSRLVGIGQVLVGLMGGWAVHVYPEGTPIPALHHAIRRHKLGVLTSTTSFFRVLLGYSPASTFPGVVRVRCGGEAVSPAFAARIAAAFPGAARHITYGSTDAGWRIATIPMEDPRVADGAVGMPLPTVEVRVRPLPGIAPPRGELCVRGPGVMLGWIGVDGAHVGVPEDGWFPTRDLVHVAPDGCLYVHGRVDALFKSGARWVNPVEVERVLSRMPGVAEVRCFAAPHAFLGLMPVAEVVPGEGQALQPESLQAFCRGKVEDQEVPREFRIVAGIARVESGKALRH